MLTLFKKTYSLIIIYAIALHLAWGLTAIIDPSSMYSTALSSIREIFGATAAPYVCIAAAGLSAAGFEVKSGINRLLMMIPQQLLMIISAGGAAAAIAASQFADGVVRSRGFIVADQAPAIIAAALHTYAVIHTARR